MLPVLKLPHLQLLMHAVYILLQMGGREGGVRIKELLHLHFLQLVMAQGRSTAVKTVPLERMVEGNTR